jgi:hypothetical protein
VIAHSKLVHICWVLYFNLQVYKLICMFVVNRYVVSDLLPGKKYTFRVVAHNMLGTSPPSSNVEDTTLSSAPEAPLAPTFSKIMPTSVHIKWFSPARDNGMPVTR